MDRFGVLAASIRPKLHLLNEVQKTSSLIAMNGIS
jgi:hypothetical protein